MRPATQLLVGGIENGKTNEQIGKIVCFKRKNPHVTQWKT